jgi:hypothetical protein
MCYFKVYLHRGFEYVLRDAEIQTVKKLGLTLREAVACVEAVAYNNPVRSRRPELFGLIAVEAFTLVCLLV